MKRGVCRQAGILPEPCSGSPAVDVTANNFAAFLGMRRCKNWAHKNLLLKKFNYLKAYSASFSQKTECFIPDFHPELLSGALKVSSCSSHDLIFVDVGGKCQSSVGRAPFCS